MSDWKKTGPDHWHRDYAAPFYANTWGKNWSLNTSGAATPIAYRTAEDPRAACDAFVAEFGKALAESAAPPKPKQLTIPGSE